MRAKFSLGDPVRFTDRASNVPHLRKRTRKIVAYYYSQDLQASLYELGANGGKHHSGQWFRSYELYPVNGQGHKIGRPDRKIDAKLRMTRHSQKTSPQPIKPVVSYDQTLKLLNPKLGNRHNQKLGVQIQNKGDDGNG